MRRNFLKKVAVATAALGLTISSLSADSSTWPKEIVFGAIPVAGNSSMEEQFGPLAKYLQDTLGIKVTLKVTNDYTGIITGMAHNHIDFAYLGPNSYVTASQRANAEAVAMEVNDEGVAGYHALIVARKDSGIKTLDDAKGKTWAFTDPQSTSGTLVPTVHFNKIGIDPQKYFSRVIYSGSHEASMLSVKAGRVDVASNNDLDFNRGIGRHWEADEFNIIWKSDLIPGSPIAVRGGLPTSLKMAIKGAFIAYKVPEGSSLKMSGYTHADDSTYNPTRELIKAKEAMKK
ncbi:phosphonate ABC transporter substrate-binding protein [Arcobacter sp. FWKO B]|uniref:phosphonate ABC transporter substrate-binding protein n=1 Tax=Arcobacter sp. FWKO B TaxID=2593672 RepID=UPI0018A348F4|nr:phosphonate ABC transporter substrate-binding protein [Arcobacter sp. FWKO B]QOG12341.1 phosphonate ABC transporter substrate-binding protein [Arcobacter sp. FWKO B]